MKKVVLITGTSRGLGKAIYHRLINNKNLIVYGTSRTPIHNELLKLDTRSSESVDQCIKEVINKEGRVDVLVNNVGSNLIGSLEGTTIEECLDQIENNYLGSIRMIKGVMPYFRENNQGHIINISSLGARVALPYNSGYSAGKAGLEAMSKSLYYELMDDKISVTLVRPIGLEIDGEIPNIKYIANEKPWYSDSMSMLNRMKAKVRPSVSKDAVAKRIEWIIMKESKRFLYNVGFESRVILMLQQVLPLKLFGKIIKKMV